MRFVGRGMHLEFHHPEYSTPIITSCIQEIRDCPHLVDAGAELAHRQSGISRPIAGSAGIDAGITSY
jgi:hypothetical protein